MGVDKKRPKRNRPTCASPMTPFNGVGLHSSPGQRYDFSARKGFCFPRGGSSQAAPSLTLGVLGSPSLVRRCSKQALCIVPSARRAGCEPPGRTRRVHIRVTAVAIRLLSAEGIVSIIALAFGLAVHTLAKLLASSGIRTYREPIGALDLPHQPEVSVRADWAGLVWFW